MSFDQYKLKRQVHALSRNTAQETWNPFRHVNWDRQSGRANTWGGADESRLPTAAGASTPALPPVHVAGSVPALRTTQSDANSIRSVPTRTATIRTQDGGGIPAAVQEGAETAAAPRLPYIDTGGATPALLVTPPTPRIDRRETIRKNIKENTMFRRVEPKEPYTVANQIQRTFLAAWINVMLVCVPAGFCLNFVKGGSIETFIVNLAAAMPLLVLGDDALDQISLRLGDMVGGLIYIFTSNLVQLISCIVLLAQDQGEIIQFTLVGGILANLLLVLGSSLFFGGLQRPCQYFNRESAHVSSNLLSLASTSLLIPTASKLLGEATPENLSRQSRGAAFVLILVYALFLLFQLVTHKAVFHEEAQKVPKKPWSPIRQPPEIRNETARHGLGFHAVMATSLAHMENGTEALQAAIKTALPPEEDNDDDAREPHLHFGVAVASFVISTVLLAFCIEFAISSIDELTSQTSISKTFVGLILLPLPNCDFSAVTSAVNDKMDLSMNYTVGKCLQTALFVTPLVVLLAWPLNVAEVTLVFNGFEIVSLFVAVLLLNFLMIEGKVTWIQGVLLLADWVLIAVAAYYATLIDGEPSAGFH